MKKKVLYFVLLIFIALSFYNCNLLDIGSPDDDNNVQFLAFYKPNNEKFLGDNKLVAKITVKNGEISYSSFLDVYPDRSLINDCDINNNVLAMGLFWRDFDNKGIYLNLDDTEYKELPLIEAENESHYSYIKPSSVDVSDNGIIIYISATNHKAYGDEYRPYLLRFNPSDNTYDVAESPNSFVLSQPEVGNDTEAGLLQTTLFASPDGKYAYGELDGFGVDGGSYHWDYEILFKYDFEQKTYTRLGDANDNDVSIIAMTSDRRYILYSNNGTRKLLDLQTDNISTTDMHTINVKKNSWGKNGCCVGASTGDLYYKDFVNNKEILVCKTGYGWAYNAMFSKDESKIYFLKEGSDKNYLCVTSGLSEGSTCDTIGALPTEFYDMVMIK